MPGNQCCPREVYDINYDSEQAAAAIVKMCAGPVSAEVHEALEMYLLSVLNTEGGAALLRKMQGFPRLDSVYLESSEPPDSRIRCKLGDRSVLVYVFEMEDLFSIHVVTEEPQPEQVPKDPHHRWFYERWEAMLGMDFDEEVCGRSEVDRAVYLVALLEAEVMNGGLGQYLTNTEGRYLGETMVTLNSVGATGIARILAEAVGLKGANESFIDLWDTKTAQLEKLDVAFLECGEDLAGLVAQIYSQEPEDD